jgi:hypothetical protein
MVRVRLPLLAIRVMGYVPASVVDEGVTVKLADWFGPIELADQLALAPGIYWIPS